MNGTSEPALLPHQAEARAWLLERPRAVLADDVGLGKTPTTLATLTALRDGGDLNAPGGRVLYLVPSEELVRQVAGEARVWCPWATIGTSVDKHVQKATGSAPAGDLVVATYATALARLGAYTTLNAPVVVLDEVSVIDGGEKQHRAVLALTAKASRVIGLTATLLENEPTETYRILEAVATPGLWSWEDYAQRYVAWQMAHPKTNDNRYIPNDTPTGWLGGAPHPDVLRHLRDNVLRRTAADVGLRLPTRVGPFDPEFVPLLDAQKREYRKASQRNDMGAIAAQTKASMYHGLDSPLAARAVREIVDHPGEKFLLYCETLEVLTIAGNYLRRAAVPFVRIDGNKSKADRAKAVEAFWAPDGPRVLLGSRVLERGLNLQVARRLISLGTSWNPGRELQREGRIRRIGSPHDTYSHLYLLPDVDLAKAQIGVQQRKQRQSDQLSA